MAFHSHACCIATVSQNLKSWACSLHIKDLEVHMCKEIGGCILKFQELAEATEKKGIIERL